MVDPFWHKVQDAYRMALNDSQKIVEVEQDGMKARVYQTNMEDNVAVVEILIMQIPIEPPTLISPQ